MPGLNDKQMVCISGALALKQFTCHEQTSSVVVSKRISDPHKGYSGKFSTFSLELA
jgi:hypothetical protein